LGTELRKFQPLYRRRHRLEERQFNLDRFECLKILDFSGREFCLLVEVVDPGSVTTSFRRLGRAEFFLKCGPVSGTLLVGPGVGGMKNWAKMDVEIPSENSFFKGCTHDIFELI
jgi:hypothetical protein